MLHTGKRKRNRCSIEEDEATDAKADEGGVRRLGRDVFFHCEVSRTNVLTLIERLREAEQEARQQRTDSFVSLYINSEGGDAYAGLSAMNHIQSMSVPVVCVADGFVASAATFMLLGGRKRLAMPHATILIHQFSTAFWGKYADLIDELENSHQLMNSFREVYRERTKLKKKRIDALLKKELTMTASQCVKFGVVEALVCGPIQGV